MNASAHDSSPTSDRVASWADGGRGVVAVVGLGLVWAVVAWVGSRGNASTFDEPVHVAAAVAAVQAGELGVNPEHPPVWKYVAGLGQVGRETGVDVSFIGRSAVRGDVVGQWAWAVDGLYGGKVDGEAVVARSRAAMLVFGVLLVVVAGLMGRRMGGGLAGVVVAALVAADPLVLAHGAIVSNDVALSVFVLGVVWVAWEIRRGGHWSLGLLLGVLVGLAAATKFTGVVVAPALAAGLLLISRKPKVLPLALAVLAAYATVWAAYGFRYAPSPEGRLIDTTAIATRIGELRRIASGAKTVPQPDGPTRALLAIEKTRIVPQAMTAGLLTSYGVTRSNPAYALGQTSMTGWWWYFPFAMLVKTPLGLLGVWAWGVRRGGWLVGCAGFVLLASMASPLNIGVRHVLPVAVMLTVAGGVALARNPRWAWVAVVAVVLEVATVFPHTLAFFNLPARAVGETQLLGDSNLDWGQDLERLAEWRKNNPGGTMYLAYWGTAAPGAYGLDSGTGVVHLPGTYPYAEQAIPGPPTGEGYVAVSVSYLQGVQSGEVAPFFARLGKREPVAKVGKSVWVYRW